MKKTPPLIFTICYSETVFGPPGYNQRNFWEFEHRIPEVTKEWIKERMNANRQFFETTPYKIEWYSPYRFVKVSSWDDVLNLIG